MDWTPEQTQSLADAYAAKNPTWSPDPSYGVTVNPVTFDPMADVGYASGAASLNNINTHAQTEHDYQLGRGGQNFGYDSTGALISDPNNPNYNPFSQAAVLQHYYDNQKRGTTNSYAAQGQLYSGALVNKRNSDQYGYNKSSDSIQRGAQDFYHGNDRSLQGTLDNSGLSLSQLLGPAFDRFTAGQGKAY